MTKTVTNWRQIVQVSHKRMAKDKRGTAAECMQYIGVGIIILNMFIFVGILIRKPVRLVACSSILRQQPAQLYRSTHKSKHGISVKLLTFIYSNKKFMFQGRMHECHYKAVNKQRPRSATQQMMVPRHRLSIVGRQAFTVQVLMVWNSLPDDLRAQQDYESFRQRLETWLFSSY